MSGDTLTLYHYWRSSASYRVRIALNLKGLDYGIVPISLLAEGGQQHKADYRQLNPQSLVPTLIHNGRAIGQSLAIIEYLDEQFPQHLLRPSDPWQRAVARGMALYIASEGQPLMNLRVLQYLENQHGLNDQAKAEWVRHWLAVNFSNIEQQLASHAPRGAFVYGAQPGIVDCCLVPHAYAAARYELDVSVYPILSGILEHCHAHPAFIRAHPGRQPDTPEAFQLLP